MQNDPLDMIYTAHLWLTELEKAPRDFGTGETINPSAIHTLTAVSKKPGCNLTRLAEELKVSKAAASKFVAPLLKQGYLVKHAPKKPQGREVFFALTDKGRTAVRGHERFSESVFGPLREIAHRLSPQESDTVRRYLETLLAEIKR